MSIKSVFVTAAIAATAAGGVAEAADCYLFQLDATVPSGIHVSAYLNGVLDSTVDSPGKAIITSFGIQNDAVLPISFDNQFNYYNASGMLVDTVHTYGAQGDNFFDVDFRSPGTLSGALPSGGVYTWTPGFLPGVNAGPVSNGDFYDLQIASNAAPDRRYRLLS